MTANVQRCDGGWVLDGPASDDVRLVNDYLSYLGDRHYAAGTLRGYAFDLLAFLRWLDGQERRLDQVGTDVLLAFLASCRSTTASEGLAPATVNRRLAAIRSTVDPGRAAHDLPVSPGPGRGPGGASARVAALLRYLP